MKDSAIEVRDFRKTYGDFVAVDGISFDVNEGEIFGLLGPNGAGKTSTLECLEGLRIPNGGSLRVAGMDPARESRKLRNLIGVQLQSSGLPESMTPDEAMRFFCAYHDVAPRMDLLKRLGGVLIGVISPSSRMTVLWSQIVFLPSMLLGGLMLPYKMLPAIAGKAAQLLPATQAMNAFNGLAMGKVAAFSPWGSVIMLFVSGVLGFGLAVYLFSWDSRNTTRRGHPLLALLVLLPYALGIFLFS